MKPVACCLDYEGRRWAGYAIYVEGELWVAVKDARGRKRFFINDQTMLGLPPNPVSEKLLIALDTEVPSL